MDWIDKLNKELQERREKNSTPVAKQKAKERVQKWIASQGGKAAVDKLNKINKKNGHINKLTKMKVGVPRSQEIKNKIYEGSKHSWKTILQFDKEGNFIKKWEKFAIIEKELSYKKTNICQVCKGNPKRKSAYGFIWKYKENN